MPRPHPPAPVELFRTALSRLTPMVGASFASVFLRDPDDAGLLRLACAVNWPQSSARFLGDVRIREGRGPTGRAVRTGAPVEVEDVFRDPALEDWWIPAGELGFVSMISAPLSAHGQVVGAVSFYFADRTEFTEQTRHLLALAARQLGAVAASIPDAVSPSRSAPDPGSR